MKSFEQKLSEAITLCEGKFLHFKNGFHQYYPFTTENIADYINFFDLENKSLLTVGSSGDQILNAYLHGARDITLIDVNEYAKFYIYLKISAILCLNYSEFKEFFFEYGNGSYYNKKRYSNETFSKLKSTLRLLDYESYLFFDELFTLFKGDEIKNNLSNIEEERPKIITEYNVYLRDEEIYNILKHRLKGIYFNFYNENIYTTNIDRKFDNIFLSNLCTYCTPEELKKLVDKLSKNNLNENGKILFAYLYNVKFNETYYEENWKEIYKMPVMKEIFKEYIHEYLEIKGDYAIMWDHPEKKEDLVLIYKKK